jgi:putative RNA 2'-phosphotransferase
LTAIEKYRELNKFLSYVLRHKPDLIDIKLDKSGWADVNDLILKINNYGKSIDLAALDNVVSTCDKKRFAFNSNKTKIRANQGHSINIDHGFESRTPPDVLYHGTAKKNEAGILRFGLNKGKRHHVHLSENIKVAIKVGIRHGKPIVFAINSEEMNSDGYTFYKSENDVWLTDRVPVNFLRRIRDTAV